MKQHQILTQYSLDHQISQDLESVQPLMQYLWHGLLRLPNWNKTLQIDYGLYNFANNMITLFRSTFEYITFDAPILSRARYEPIITPYIMMSMHIFQPRAGLIPALLTRIWTFPLNASSVCAHIASQSSSFATSHLQKAKRMLRKLK